MPTYYVVIMVITITNTVGKNLEPTPKPTH